MRRTVGSPNKITTEVKGKLQTVMDDVVSQLDISEMTTDQKIKMLQIGLQYLLPKLKHVSEEIEHKDVPLFVDIITRDESGEGWETERRPLNIGNSE
ncbi:hypothetical protein N9T61_01735 [Flavobacteriaceae bacterium]|nr:hypothetical protein [Flavobacteriaceae bacterium]